MPAILNALIIAIHVIVCIALMVVILLQSGKGGGLAGAFGAGSSQTLFGGRGAATFLSRTTTVLATVFFLTSLTLGLAATRGGRNAGQSLVTQEARQRAQQRAAQQGAGAPAAPSPSLPPGAAPGQAPGTTPQTPAPSGGTGN
jgi:preprotein translocase subunit SecG